MKTKLLAGVALIIWAQAGSAQSILDTFRAFKSNALSLGHGSKSTNTTQASTASNGPSPIDQSSHVMAGPESLANDSVDSHLAENPLRKNDVDTFDILGVKLGMSPKEFDRVLKPRGPFKWELAAYQLRPDFESEARIQANSMLNVPANIKIRRVFAYNQAYLKDGSQVTIESLSEPSGSEVESVIYRSGLNGQTKEQVIAAAVNKYGPYAAGSAYSYAWCARPKPCGRANQDGLDISFSESSVVFSLYHSWTHANSRSGMIKARAQKIASSNGSGVAF